MSRKRNHGKPIYHDRSRYKATPSPLVLALIKRSRAVPTGRWFGAWHKLLGLKDAAQCLLNFRGFPWLKGCRQIQGRESITTAAQAEPSSYLVRTKATALTVSGAMITAGKNLILNHWR